MRDGLNGADRPLTFEQPEREIEGHTRNQHVEDLHVWRPEEQLGDVVGPERHQPAQQFGAGAAFNCFAGPPFLGLSANKELRVETASGFNDHRRDARLPRGADCN